MNPNPASQFQLSKIAGAVALTLGLAAAWRPRRRRRLRPQTPSSTMPRPATCSATSYFDRRSAGDDNGSGSFRNQALGLGGWLYGNTGEIGQVLSFGGTYNFTLPLYGPDETPYNYILRDPGQDTVSVLGEAYGKLRFGSEAVIVLGRQSISQAWYLDDVVRFYNKLDQSMIGRRDVRAMEPINYEAATAQGRLADDTVRYYGGYVWNARQINDNDFRNLYQAAYQSTVWPEKRRRVIPRVPPMPACSGSRRRT